jgi:hypothetical protein
MTTLTDATHDPALRSWVASANDGGPTSRSRTCRTAASAAATSPGASAWPSATRCSTCAWRASRPLGRRGARAAGAAGRRRPERLHGAGPRGLAQAGARGAVGGAGRGQRPGALPRACLVPQAQAEMSLPCRIGDYTDFYAGIHHARTIGKLFRPDNPLLPNYQWVPIGYHGRASSIGWAAPSAGPAGSSRARADAPPVFGPCQRLDYELEVGAFVGRANALGEPVPMAEAEETRCSAWCCSTTGRRATSRPGSTSRWAPSWPRASPQFDLALDRDDGGAGAVPPPVHAARRRPAAAALPGLAASTASRRRDRHHAGGLAADRGHARGRHSRRCACRSRT